MNGWGWFWWLAHAKQVLKVKRFAFPGELLGDGEAYAVARASRNSNFLEKNAVAILAQTF